MYPWFSYVEGFSVCWHSIGWKSYLFISDYHILFSSGYFIVLRKSSSCSSSFKHLIFHSNLILYSNLNSNLFTLSGLSLSEVYLFSCSCWFHLNIPLSESTIFHCFIDFLMTFSPAGYPIYLHFVDFYMTFSSASHYTAHFLMTSSSPSLPQVTHPSHFLYSLLTNTLMGYILSPESSYPYRVFIRMIHSHSERSLTYVRL